MVTSIDLVETLTKEKLEALHEISNVNKRNVLLKNKLQQAKDSMHSIAANYQAQIDQRDSQIEQLKDNLNKIKLDATHDIRVTKMKTQLEIQEMKNEHFHADSEMRENLEIAQEELKELLHYRDMRHIAKEKMDELEHTIRLLEEKCVLERTEQTQRSLMEMSKMKKACEAKIEDVEKRARAKARTDFDVMVTKIVEDNKKLSAELRSQLLFIGELQKEKDALQEQLHQCQREITLHKEKAQEYAQQMYEHIKTKKELTTRLQNLDKELNDRIKESNRHIEDIKRKKELELKSAKSDYLNSKQILQRKDTELTKIKKLVQTILGQRSEVEEFISDSLIRTKEMIERGCRINHDRIENTSCKKVRIIIHRYCEQ